MRSKFDNLLRFIALLFLLSPVSVNALPEPSLVPGGIALLGISDYQQGTMVRFDNKQVAIFAYENTWYAIAGIPLNAAIGDHEFSIEHHNGITLKTRVTIVDKKYQEQHLTIKNKRKVNPDKEDLKRIARERPRKKKAKSVRTNAMPDIDFIWPVTGRISSIFGLRRFFNEQERNPHNGLDIAASEGTPVQAAANGTVIDAGNFFFSGNIIFLDHGQGIITLYAHLSKINVKPGEQIKKGDIIGAVGQTGRVTGAHLHFAVIANQTLIDPVNLLPKNQPEAHQLTKELN